MSAANPTRTVVRRVTVLVTLAAVWTLLWGDYSPGTALVGLMVATVIVTVLPLPKVPIQGRVHVVSLLRLITRVAWFLLVSSVQVSWLAIRPGSLPLSAVLRVQLAVKSDLVLVFASNILSMMPGSLVLEIDQTRRVLFCHVINAGSARAMETFRHQVTELERLLLAAFERDADWRPRRIEGNP
ncbi:Na+/H+ antiporter subunit E [Mycobacterium camsae]|uniref:Na+/H+ antiporter subunit E n=1 Tax=Mycobacterium gordonae TaxID=1778 RepID=UPI00197E1484|nr:Na+/H+ antiporter subunit E [Mycobacterium gordonae]